MHASCYASLSHAFMKVEELQRKKLEEEKRRKEEEERKRLEKLREEEVSVCPALLE